MLAAPPEPGLAWFRLLASTTVVDFPLPIPAGGQARVATMWPDGRAPYGWAQRFWEPGADGRGFVPSNIELGDVVEFAVRHPALPHLPAAHPAPPGTGPAGQPAVSTWYGYLHAVRADAIVIHGPFPSPQLAYAAAQQALVRQINQPPEAPPRGMASSAQLGPSDPGVSTAPAQPPAGVSVTFNGNRATVGDPVHGWMVVDSQRLTAALGHSTHDLAAHLNHAVPHLAGRISGHEAPLTLAALTAQHLPYNLPPPAGPAPAPAPPVAAPPVAAPATAPPGAAQPGSGTTSAPPPTAPAAPSSGPHPGPADAASATPPSPPPPPDAAPPTPGMSLP